VIIAFAVLINSAAILNQENYNKFGTYYIIFWLSAVFDIFSHLLKESLVRSVPIDQSKFNLNISVS
jgi:hypothetical protein